MEAYLQRVVDSELMFRLDAFGAVLITGPKWCGKTTTAEQQSKSFLYLQDPDHRDEYMETAAVKPSLLLKGEYPRLLDEWQEAPVLWDAVRRSVDQEQREGLYLLTGSASVDQTKIHHTGTGRISRMEMFTMSLFESGESSGTVSLRTLFDNPDADIDGAKSAISVEELIFAACRGGWPSSINKKSDRAKLAVATDYMKQIAEVDISTVDGITRNPSWTNAILRSYARNISTLATGKSLYQDIVNHAESFSLDTLDSYRNALEKLFVIRDVPAWCPSIRSQTAIRSGKKREFTDPSMAVSALGLTPSYFEHDLKTFGFIFECLCIRDLRVYSQSMDGELSYYHDRYGLEADAVLYLRDGRYALLEFKLGAAGISSGAEHLLKLRDLIRKHNETETQVPLREPDLLIVMTGTETAFRREDGVIVLPIGCLRD